MKITGPSSELPEESPIDSAALAWLLERDEGFGPGRDEAFSRWCAADPRHDAAVTRAERGLRILAQLPDVRAPIAQHLAASHRAVPDRRWSSLHPRWAAWWSGLAAAFAILAVGWWVLAHRTRETDYATATAVQRQVGLADGSVLDLNSHTALSVRLTARERRVVLRAGEAHFAVAHDAARPFIVVVDGVEVRAVGTAFSVRRALDGVAVVVTDGRVEIVQVGGLDAPRVTNRSPQVAVGERAWVSRADSGLPPRVDKLDASALRAALAWQSPAMNSASLPLVEVVREFNRHNRTQFVIADAEIAGRRIGGSFVLDRVEALIRLLELESDIVLERRGPDEIVVRRAR